MSRPAIIVVPAAAKYPGETAKFIASAATLVGR